jgi:urease accessory protein
MSRARAALPAGSWAAGREVGTVTLDWDDRHRRRIRLALDRGGAILLDLPQAARLGDGDGLLLEDGGIVRVVAAAEPVLEIRRGTTSLPRIAYHLGNRHLPIEILPDLLVIRHDHVIEDMVLGLGGEIRHADRPFAAEAGAYGGGHSHGHEHDDHHEHEHEHGHGDGHHHDR